MNTTKIKSKRTNNKNENQLLQKEKISSKDIYQKITDLITQKLSSGIIPWENPLINSCRIQNLITNHIYSGVNTLILSMSKTPYFMTFKQAKEIGANIKKGAKSLPVVFWSVGSYEKENLESKEIEICKSFLLKYYNVFNISDIENIPAKYIQKIQDKTNNNCEIPTAQEIVDNYKNPPTFEYCVGTPHYSPSEDTIRTPQINYFKSSNHFYSTLFHEMAHSTGHLSRLNRFNNEHSNLSFGSKDYAKEELTAELTASFLMSETAETININNRVAYIQSWLKALNNDSRLIVSAANKAQKATNYILGRKEENSCLDDSKN